MLDELLAAPPEDGIEGNGPVSQLGNRHVEKCPGTLRCQIHLYTVLVPCERGHRSARLSTEGEGAAQHLRLRSFEMGREGIAERKYQADACFGNLSPRLRRRPLGIPCVPFDASRRSAGTLARRHLVDTTLGLPACEREANGRHLRKPCTPPSLRPVPGRHGFATLPVLALPVVKS